MLKPFISVSIVSHNEVILLIVEIEQHQRSALCSFETPDESIHSFLLNLLLFFLGRSSLVSLFYFSFRLHFCGSLLADVANFSFFFSLKLISIWDFLNKSSLLVKDLLLLCFFSLNRYLDTAGDEEPTTGSNIQNYLYLLIQRRGQRRPDFSSSGQTGRSV